MTLNIAHRGFSGLYPENTLLSFTRAVEAGADGIELDVQLCRDGEAVVIHDENVRRVSGRTGAVKDLTLFQLKALDVCVGWPAEMGHHTVPTLREYFEMIRPTRLITNIELKNSVIAYPGLEEKALALIDEFRMGERVMLSSFNHASMARVKALRPDMPCGLLVGARLNNAGQYVKANGCDFLNPAHETLDRAALEETRRAGVGVNAWTVDDESVMRNLLGGGVYSIITNRPDRLRRIMEAM